MAEIAKDVLDSLARGSVNLWRYKVDHSDFTEAAAQTETISITPIVATGGTLSGGGIVVLDAWVQVHEVFAEPRAADIDLSFGPTSVDSTALIRAVPVIAGSGSGTLRLEGLAVADKGALLVGAAGRDAGQTIWINENDPIKVTLEVTAPAVPNETTQGIATLVVMYVQVPESN
jgi:hypothetical protein